MPTGGLIEAGKHAGSDGASLQPPAQPVHERDLEEQAEKNQGQDVQGSARGLPSLREASQIDPTTLMASIAALMEGQVALQGDWPLWLLYGRGKPPLPIPQ